MKAQAQILISYISRTREQNGAEGALRDQTASSPRTGRMVANTKKRENLLHSRNHRQGAEIGRRSR